MGCDICGGAHLTGDHHVFKGYHEEEKMDELKSWNDLKQEVKNMVCENRDLKNERDELKVRIEICRKANVALLGRNSVQAENMAGLEKEIERLKGVIEHLELKIFLLHAPHKQTTFDEQLGELEKRMAGITRSFRELRERIK